MFKWLWKTEPEAPSLRQRVADLEDLVADVRQHLRRVEKELEDHQEGLDRRFGRLNARLKRSQSDELEEAGPQEEAKTPVNDPGNGASGLRDWRARRFGGLLR